MIPYDWWCIFQVFWGHTIGFSKKKKKKVIYYLVEKPDLDHWFAVYDCAFIRLYKHRVSRWVNNGWIWIFEWTIPLNHEHKLSQTDLVSVKCTQTVHSQTILHLKVTTITKSQTPTFNQCDIILDLAKPKHHIKKPTVVGHFNVG